jgi:energy-coupling factor transport system ATP-binding protein
MTGWKSAKYWAFHLWKILYGDIFFCYNSFQKRISFSLYTVNKGSKMIVFEAVDFSYQNPEGNDIPALKGINLTVAEGESVLVLGGNGSGKTTLLKLACGLLLPTVGTIRIQGTDTKSNCLVLPKIVSLVLSRPRNMIFSPIVEEDVAFGPECQGLPSEEIRTRVDQSLQMVGMGQFRRAQIHRLSGGEQQKVVLAGAIAQNPGILLLDEPTAYLDSGESRRLLDQVRKLQDSMTLMVATQNPDPAFRADQVLVLHEGRSVFYGSPVTLSDKAEILKTAGLIPPKAVLLGKQLRKSGLPIEEPYHTPELLVKQLCKLWSQTSATPTAKAP